MRKITAVILSLVLCATVLCACGRKTDSDGNTLITSDWKCVSYTINGAHEDLTDDSIFIKIMMSKDNPKFECKDGVNFRISVLKKWHSGTLTLNEDGTYHLTPATGKGLNGKIEGNTLTLYSDDGKLEMVFETK